MLPLSAARGRLLVRGRSSDFRISAWHPPSQTEIQWHVDDGSPITVSGQVPESHRLPWFSLQGTSQVSPPGSYPQSGARTRSVVVTKPLGCSGHAAGTDPRGRGLRSGRYVLGPPSFLSQMLISARPLGPLRLVVRFRPDLMLVSCWLSPAT